MRFKYFIANATSNGAQLISLAVLSIFLTNEKFGEIREFVAIFLVVSALSQLGLSTSLISSWSSVKRKNSTGLILLVFVGVASFFLSKVYFSDTDNPSLIFLSIYLYALPLVTAAVFQAYGNHNLLLFFQNYPKIVFYFSLLSYLFFQYNVVFLSFHLSLLILLPFVAFCFYWPKPSRLDFDGVFNDVSLLLKKSFVPFVLTASSTLMQNFEFMLMPKSVTPEQLGAFSKISLVFSGSVALLFFLQNRAISAYLIDGFQRSTVRKQSLSIFLFACFIVVLIFCAIYFFEGFREFLFYDEYPVVLILVLSKLLVWSAFSISGILLYHLGYGFICLLLAFLPILVAVVLEYFQLVSNLAQLLLCSIAMMVISGVIVNYFVFSSRESS